MNEKPVKDVHEALYLLRAQQGDKGPRYIFSKGDEFEIHHDWFHDGGSGSVSSGIHYLEIQRDVVGELLQKKFVQNMKILRWGSTHVDLLKFVLSELGKLELARLDEEQKTVAHSILKPGIHSQWSSIFNYIGKGREHERWGGRLYFDFKTPIDEKVRMFPDTGEFQKF